MSRESVFVVLGRVTEVETTSVPKWKTAIGRIQVKRYLKGTSDARTIDVQFSFSPTYPRGAPGQDDFIWFVRGKLKNGRYLVSNGNWGKQSLDRILTAIYYSDPSAGNPWTSKGEPEKLTHTIATDKREYFLGEPIKLTCTWKNEGDKELKLLSWTGPPSTGKPRLGWAISSLSYAGDAGWEPLPWRGPQASPLPRPRIVLLPGHGVIQESRQLNADPETSLTFVIDRPGKYRVRSVYPVPQHEGYDDAWHGAAPAREVHFTVVETRYQKAAKVISRRLPVLLVIGVAVLAAYGATVYWRLRRRSRNPADTV